MRVKHLKRQKSRGRPQGTVVPFVGLPGHSANPMPSVEMVEEGNRGQRKSEQVSG